jgi:hypothetical protein
MVKPHFWNHNDVDHQPDFTDVSTSTYTTQEEDDIVRISGNCDLTLHDPEELRYITISQISGTSSITGTGYSGTISADYTVRLAWDGSAWSAYMVSPTDLASAVLSVFGRAGIVVAEAGDYSADQVTNAFDKTADDTDDVTEGVTNIFFTDARVDANTDVADNTAHRTSDGTSHANVVLNDTHRGSDGKDHSDVVLNNDYRAIGHIPTSEKGASNGVAELDAGGKVPASQLPSTVMEYKGNWNATTNSPTLADGAGDSGDVYRVEVAGTQDLGSGSIDFEVGDWAVYNGTIWEKSLNSNAVVSVNGETGTVTVDLGNLGSGTIGELNSTITDLIPTYGGLRDIGIGTLAQRPAFGTANRFFFTTDENKLYLDTGSAWVTIEGLGTTTLAELNALVTDATLLDQVAIKKIAKKAAIIFG